jgi:hypothetical protein
MNDLAIWSVGNLAEYITQRTTAHLTFDNVGKS